MKCKCPYFRNDKCENSSNAYQQGCSLLKQIPTLEAENESLKTNIQLLGDELNSLADRYDNLDDENAKLKEVVEKQEEREHLF